MSPELKKSPYLKRILGTWGCFVFVALLLTVPLGPIPSLGEFLSPATGYLKNGRFTPNGTAPQRIQLKSIRDDISITFDVRGVPHVVAKNDLDLAFGQGFATARDRLWQMELQTAATAGRVAEILGEKAIAFDIRQRKLGFLNAAIDEVAHIQEHDKEQYLILVAYSEGVNAYVASLDPADYPIEYKLLGTAPEPWTPVKCALFHKQMSWTLTQSYDEFRLTNALQKYTPPELENLYPTYFHGSSPILDRDIAQISSAPIPQPYQQQSAMTFDGLLNLSETSPSRKPSSEGTHGSNNWVMDGVHTKHGYPVLANDPHLDLKLPSIWYEIQLTAPGVNVYGVSLPGLPHVIIGFNEDVSWGITNAGSDVLDWYAMTLDTSSSPPRYKLDGQWKPAVVKKETIKIKNGGEHSIDVLYTDFGPIAQEFNLEKKNGSTVSTPFAMKWTGTTPSNEFRVFHRINRSRSVRDLKNALRSYSVPAQNFMLADKTGSIGYVQAGLFPIRTHHFGRYVLDGSQSANDWREFIPFSHLPQTWSPDRGYIASANQQPTDAPSPGYSGGHWEFTSYLRGKRINAQLQEFATNGPTELDDLKALQNDVLALRAQMLVPLFVGWARAEKSSAEIAQALDLLSGWDFELRKDSIEASIWSSWWDTFYEKLWEDAFPAPNYKPPSEDRTMELLLGDTTGGWPQAPQILPFNQVPELALESLRGALERIKRFNAQQNSNKPFPVWGEFRGTTIPHLARLTGFGIEHLPTGGNGDTVNATTTGHGPSWRMVVTWKDAQPQAWGVYPGGQSGHIGSNQYANMIEPWSQGTLDRLLFMTQGGLTADLIQETLHLEVLR